MKNIIWVCIWNSVVIFASEFQAMENACDNNVAEACEELGYLHQHGQGVEKDIVKAKEYYVRACEYGFQKACKLLDDLEKKEK